VAEWAGSRYVKVVMSRWIDIGSVCELPPGAQRAVRAEGLALALFNHEGEFFAIDDTCPHQGASLSEGSFHEGRVICPLHSWVFDVKSGRCPRGSHEPVGSYVTRTADGRVEIELPAEAQPRGAG
jgi:nitrite reductase/ring-hydroxylating ferredoxin subunit